MNKPQPEQILVYNYYEVRDYIYSIKPFDKEKWWDYLIEYQWFELMNDTHNVFYWEEDYFPDDPEIISIGNTFAEHFGNIIHFYISW